MMRIVVMSDTHGNIDRMQEVIKRHSDAELFVHLGDGAYEFLNLKKALKLKKCVAVKGNCDSVSLKLPNYKVVKKGGHKLFISHGNGFNVRTSFYDIVDFAKGKKADIILYGHTHKKLTKYYNGIYILNPGSLAIPKDSSPSYGIIDIEKTGVVLNTVELK